MSALPGLLAVGCAMVLSYLATLVLPAVNALTAAVVLGVLAGNLPILPASCARGLRWATRWFLRAGVVLLGLQLSVFQLLELGLGSIAAVLLTVTISFVGTLAIGKLLGIGRGLSLLVAGGFSICGASAVVAMEGVVRRRDADVATAIALVTLYGGLAIAAVPLAGPLLGLSGSGLGQWAGLSVHEVAQVVAAASPAGAAAVSAAVLIKLCRVVLLAPMVAGVSIVERRAARNEPAQRPPLIPLFIIGFLAMVAVRSTGVLGQAAIDLADVTSTMLLAGALFGLGSAIELRTLVRTGARALLVGLLSTLLIAVTGYVCLAVLG